MTACLFMRSRRRCRKLHTNHPPRGVQKDETIALATACAFGRLPATRAYSPCENCGWMCFMPKNEIAHPYSLLLRQRTHGRRASGCGRQRRPALRQGLRTHAVTPARAAISRAAEGIPPNALFPVRRFGSGMLLRVYIVAEGGTLYACRASRACRDFARGGGDSPERAILHPALRQGPQTRAGRSAAARAAPARPDSRCARRSARSFPGRPRSRPQP